MPNLISIKLDCKLLDKARFFQGKANSNGHSPLYIDLVLIPRKEAGKYGETHLVKQSKKKDEQVELPIIGSATERGGQPAQQPHRQSTPPPSPLNAGGNDNKNEDCPF